MRPINFIIICLTSCFAVSCNHQNKDFINDSQIRQQVKEQFNARKEQLLHARHDQLLSILDQDISLQEKEALEFLYAYLPLSDLSNYSGAYYLEQVQYAFKAQKEFSWGNSVDEELFRHFVLPPRAGTENLDSARKVFFYELKDRVKGMNMKEAALEINHWCHEKVTYKGSDERTSAPLATVKNAYGRCGEESVFTVVALRAVGIPARQIYTPRWVHQDDNHAWVEFWADGHWYFYGACEPEPDVNQGWFVEPSRRAILTATPTLGKYDFEPIIKQEELYTRLNRVSNYTNSDKLYVQVLNNRNTPISGAQVRFMVYNYAELYNIAELRTDESGICALELGLGDIIVWAFHDGDFAFKKTNVTQQDTLSIILEDADFANRTVDFDLVPPIEKTPLPVSEEGKRTNELRLAYEDSLRNAYENHFIRETQSDSLARKYGYDSQKLWEIMQAARANWDEISLFITSVPNELRQYSLPLLDALSQKDLRDAKAHILIDHIVNTPNKPRGLSDDYYIKYLMNPRISLENLSPYKSYFEKEIKQPKQDEFKASPEEIAKYVKEEIIDASQQNYIWVPSIPQGTHEMKAADAHSKKIYFVALCRSFGIPARIEKATGLAQYYIDNVWNSLYFDKEKPLAKSDQGSIEFAYSKDKSEDWKYYIHFTLAKYQQDGYKTLEFDFNQSIKDFPGKISLDVGHYSLTTGTRLQDGTVLLRIKFFELKTGQHLVLQPEFRKDENPAQVIANIDLPRHLTSIDKAQVDLDINKQGGYVFIWIDPDKEPSKHVLKDFEDLKATFEGKDKRTYFLIPEGKLNQSFSPENYNLPDNAQYCIDSGFLQELEIVFESDLSQRLPVSIVANSKGNVFYFQSGYKIGVGEQILQVLGKMPDSNEAEMCKEPNE